MNTFSFRLTEAAAAEFYKPTEDTTHFSRFEFNIMYTDTDVF
jgi:hypothetical protein